MCSCHLPTDRAVPDTFWASRSSSCLILLVALVSVLDKVPPDTGADVDGQSVWQLADHLGDGHVPWLKGV